MRTDSPLARAVFAPALQSLYAWVRQIPLLGEFSHKLARRVLPAGARINTRVRKGQGVGLCLYLDPRYEAQYAAGLHETALLESLAAHLRQGDVFYDVGAHIGFISLVSARLVGPKGRVFAFEADPENASRILAHAQMNSLPQIELVRAAVWSECKALSFHRAPGFSSRNTSAVVHGTENKSADGIIEVEAVTLDRFALDHRLPVMVKIDVEGAEEMVLKGAEMVFRESKAKLICEIHNARAADGVANWLEVLGYRWNWLDKEHEFPRHLVGQANS